MRPASRAAKHGTSEDGRQKFHFWRLPSDVMLNLSTGENGKTWAGKHGTGKKCAKTWYRWNVRENMVPVKRAGKHVTDRNAGKHITGCKHGVEKEENKGAFHSTKKSDFSEISIGEWHSILTRISGKENSFARYTQIFRNFLSFQLILQGRENT